MDALSIDSDYILNNSNRVVEDCGIYFLIYRNEIVYVGQSIMVHSRLHQHGRDQKKTFDSYTVLRCDAADLDRLERHFIDKLRPKYNKDHETMRGTFRPGKPRPYANVRRIQVVTPLGYFPSIVDAAQRHGISRQAAYDKIKRHVRGWSRFEATDYPVEIRERQKPGRKLGGRNKPKVTAAGE